MDETQGDWPEAPGVGATARRGPPGKLVLIGAGHVFRVAPAIRDAITALQPDVVFVELDPGRLQVLRDRRAGKPREIPKGYVHKRLQAFQEGVAGMYGAEVGEEMLAAVDGARMVGARLLLVDPPAQDTLRRALREMTMRERFRAVGMMARNAVWQLLPGRRKGRAAVEDELRRYQEDPDGVLDEIRRTFPTIYRIVIEERDDIMATRVRAGLAGARLGLAVVGDGHAPGMLRRLGDLDVTAYRLADVRSGKLPQATGTAEVRFGFQSVFWG